MRLKIAALVAIVPISMLTSETALAHREISPDVVTNSFVQGVERFIDALDVETNAFAVRIKRCAETKDEASDDFFYVLINWRGASPSGNAAAVSSDALAAMDAAGWESKPNTNPEDGGFDISGSDPATGAVYSVKTGLDTQADTGIVGFFRTRCYWSSINPVPFGSRDGR